MLSLIWTHLSRYIGHGWACIAIVRAGIRYMTTYDLEDRQSVLPTVSGGPCCVDLLCKGALYGTREWITSTDWRVLKGLRLGSGSTSDGQCRL